MTDQQIIEAFLAWASLDRRRSPHTIRRYEGVLAAVGNAPSATREEIEAWWASRLHTSAATRANELACLRTFYKWATRFDHRDDDPTRRLDAPPIQNHVPRPISETNLRFLLGAPTEGMPDIRRAIYLGAYAGLRVSEAAALHWSMADVETKRLYVRGKGAKERLVPVSDFLMEQLLPDTRKNVVTGTDHVYKPGDLQARIHRIMQTHGINHTFHDFRKRAATRAMAGGASPQAVAQMFGWASLQTVKRYAVVADSALDDIASSIV